MRKLKILLDAIIGNFKKIPVWFHVFLNIKPEISLKVADNVIVSMTSYGRRVSNSVHYTIFSMIMQTTRPEKIILWLDKERWNNENIPFSLKRMKQWGMLDVEFCSDVRSFTKLIPAMMKYPNKIIITIDDDIYYSKNMITALYNEYCIDNHSIVALLSGSYHYENKSYSFPLGTGGVLYPPGSLSDIVFDEKLFMKLCPSLDDLWFYTMSRLKKTHIRFNTSSGVSYYGVDALYQKTHKGSRLYEVVRVDNRRILKELLEYFNL